MGPDLTIDLNFLGGDPPASIKYIGNQNQLNLITQCCSNYISVNSHSLLLLQTHVEVSIMRGETVDFPDLTGYK